ncbi:MAG: phosphatidate cytidylyltransferase [Acutalibacteraceae bacterium]|nr:phosphatidate cytidylyltransferase [Acutalibacteraceae bacterium]
MKTRVISAIIAIALLIIVLVFSSTVVLPIALALLGLIAVYEIFNVSKATNNIILLVSSALYVIATPVITYISGSMTHLNVLALFIYLMLFAVSMLMYFNKINITRSFFSVVLVIMFAFSMSACVELINKEKYAYYFVIAAICAWITDTAALFVGKYFGSKKLAPVLSPNKTVEGAIGGVVFCVLISVLYSLFYTLFLSTDVSKVPNFVSIIFIPLAASVMGIIGDLFFSAIKRFFKIKDYGNIMPGHGGVLDRFDSFIFTSSFIAIIVRYIPLIG